MARHAWLMALLLMLMGCATTPPMTREQLIGHWDGDVWVPPGTSADAKAKMKDAIARSLELKDDGTFVQKWKGVEFTGVWTQNGDRLELTMQKLAGKDPDKVTAWDIRSQIQESISDVIIDVKYLVKPMRLIIDSERKQLVDDLPDFKGDEARLIFVRTR